MRNFVNLILAGFIINLVSLTLSFSTLLLGAMVMYLFLFIALINMIISICVIVQNKKIRCSNLGPILAIIAVALVFTSLIFIFDLTPVFWETRVGLIILLSGVSLFFNLTSAIAYGRLYCKIKSSNDGNITSK